MTAFGGFIVFSRQNKAIIYNTERKTAREILYKSIQDICHSLFPDGKLFLSFRKSQNLVGSRGRGCQYHACRRQMHRQLNGTGFDSQCTQWDDTWTVYIPNRVEKLSIRWSIGSRI
ncbi:hypothetical protein FRC03_007208 [Tulasnella sp. 419]|nr:hypothetical protein FRC03_007208 [Tulasnella sp. 419]